MGGGLSAGGRPEDESPVLPLAWKTCGNSGLYSLKIM